jgi:hypothetical protein
VYAKIPHNPATTVKALLLIITTSLLKWGIRGHWSQAPGIYSGKGIEANTGITIVI